MVDRDDYRAARRRAHDELKKTVARHIAEAQAEQEACSQMNAIAAGVILFILLVVAFVCFI